MNKKKTGRGNDSNRGRATPASSSQRGTADSAPTPSGPIAGPSRHYTTRASLRLNPVMAPPSASTALGAGHASPTVNTPHSLADSDSPNHSFTPPIAPPIALGYLVVDGGFNPLGNEFIIHASPTQYIADVMESIIAKSPALSDVYAASLVLWKPLEPLRRARGASGGTPALIQLLEVLRSNPESVAERLYTTLQVVTYFDSESPRDAYIHLIVQAPTLREGGTTGGKKRKRNSVGDIADFRDAQAEDVKRAREALNLSSAAAIPEFKAQQATRPVLNGRPARNFGPPIGLFHPVFNSFHAAMRSQSPPDPSTYPSIRALFSAFAAIYDKEEDRIAAFSQHLHTLIGGRFLTVETEGVKSDGIMSQPCCGSSAYPSLTETKNEIGTGHSDPYNQGSFAYRKYWADPNVDTIRARCCCPTIIIAIAGPWMCVLGGVYLEKPIVQRLTDYIWLGGDAFDHGQLVSTSRLFTAIKSSISTLQTYYQYFDTLHLQADSFPFVREFGEQKFKYLLRLAPDYPSKLLYKAQLDDPSSNPLVVKFVSTYHAEAHLLLAQHQLAPSLHYAGTEDPARSLYGGRYMVVMDFVDGTSPDALTEAQFAEVKEAVALLHSKNLVFGDLRLPNILLKDGKVKIIDFDWCGKAGDAHYPAELNPDRELGWPPGVQPGSIMKKEHDLFMLKKLPVRE